MKSTLQTTTTSKANSVPRLTLQQQQKKAVIEFVINLKGRFVSCRHNWQLYCHGVSFVTNSNNISSVVIHLMTLSTLQTVLRQMMGRLVNNAVDVSGYCIH
jgi:hypothetical protein